MKILDWIEKHIWEIIIVGVVVRYGKTFFKTFIFDPITGPDGRASMDELAKATILGMFVYCVIKEGNRKTPEAIYTDAFFAILVSGVFAIAAIKGVVGVFKKTKDNPPEEVS